jgi:hypothetical protein
VVSTSRWFSPGTPVSSTNKSDRYDATEMLLKVVLNIIHINPNLSDRNICIETLLFKIADLRENLKYHNI